MWESKNERLIIGYIVSTYMEIVLLPICLSHFVSSMRCRCTIELAPGEAIGLAIAPFYSATFFSCNGNKPISIRLCLAGMVWDPLKLLVVSVFS